MLEGMARSGRAVSAMPGALSWGRAGRLSWECLGAAWCCLGGRETHTFLSRPEAVLSVSWSGTRLPGSTGPWQ